MKKLVAVLIFVCAVTVWCATDRVTFPGEIVGQAQLHLTALFAVLGFGMLVFRRTLKVAGIFIAATAVNFYLIHTAAPFFPPDGAPTTKGASFRVMSFNIWKDNPDQKQVIAEIKRVNPDIVQLLETYSGTYRHILDKLGAEYPFHYPPIKEVVPQSRILLSKLPFTANERVKGAGGYQNKLLDAKFEIDGETVRFIGTHYTSPRDGKRTAARNAQIADTLYYLIGSDKPKTHVIVAGDMNSAYWRPSFKEFTRLAGLNVNRDILNPVPTWPAYLPKFAGVPIDYILTSPNLCTNNVMTGEASGSDHRPIYTDMSICGKNETQ